MDLKMHTRRLLPATPLLRGSPFRQECAARRRQRFVTAMVPSFEELMLDHDAWLESVDLWRLGEEYERLEASPR